MTHFQTLTIKDIRRETPDAISILFDVPQNLTNDFLFKAGQYVTLKTFLNGQEIRRSYSICSSPKSKELRIAIKSVKGGLFSVFANKELQPEQQIEVSLPEGRFTLEPSGSNRKNYMAFAAGSGITPIMSILQTVLEEEPESTFVLLYGNKSPESTIFYKNLNELHDRYTGRFFVYYTFSQIQTDNHLFGRIDKANINFILKNKHKAITFDTYYLCGPNQMINLTRDLLKENGVSKEDIKFELFTSSENETEITQSINDSSQVTIVLDGTETILNLPKDTVILDAALKNGLDAPYSCQGGICSSCMAKITQGTALMKKNSILTDEEIADGYILTCQAIPTSKELRVDYDDL